MINNQTQNISSFLRKISQELSHFYDTANIDAKSIFCDVLDVDTTYLYINGDKDLTLEQLADIQNKVDKYKNGEPLAYILGYKYFWEQKLLVNEHTLIPRADTEILIESVLADFTDVSAKLNILDLGTGTGAIALALAGEYENAQVVAVDFSLEALKVAQKNAELNNIQNVKFITSDWYNSLRDMKFDIIVSNPPYIDADDIEMENSVVKYEPKSALVAANNGLADINIIISQSKDFLEQKGALYIEHGHKQGKGVRNIFRQNDFENIETIKDLNAKDRITKGMLLIK